MAPTVTKQWGVEVVSEAPSLFSKKCPLKPEPPQLWTPYDFTRLLAWKILALFLNKMENGKQTGCKVMGCAPSPNFDVHT